MLRPLFILFIALICAKAFSQSDSASALEFYEEFEIPSGEEIISLRPSRTASSYLISTKPGVLFLRPIDAETGLPKRVLSIRSNDEKKILNHHFQGDSIFCLVKTDNKNRSATFEVVVYTVFNDQLAEASRHQLKIENKPNERNAEKLFFRVSGNGKNAAVVRLVSYETSQEAIVNVEMIDYGSSEQKFFKLPLPFGADDLEILDVNVSNDGHVSFTALSGVRLNSPFLKKHLIYFFDPISKELHEYDLSKDKVYQQDVISKHDRSSVEVLTTSTDDPMRQAASTGYCWVSIDSNGKHISEKLIANFSPETFNLMSIDSRSGKDAVEHLFIDDIIQLGQSQIGIMHQQYRDQVCTTDPRTGILTCTDQYHRDGILVVFKNEMQQQLVVNRVQVDYDREGPYLGYTSATINNRLFILYNDHQKNTNTLAEREMNNPARANLRYVVIDEKGTNSSSAIELGLGRGFVLLPEVSGYETNNHIFRLYSDGRDFRIGYLDTEKLVN